MSGGYCSSAAVALLWLWLMEGPGMLGCRRMGCSIGGHTVNVAWQSHERGPASPARRAARAAGA
jgi:hypothetical protein